MLLAPEIIRWLTGLRMHRKAGVLSPHKPVLLLAVLEMADSGALATNAVPFSPLLFEHFAAYWRAVQGEPVGRIAYPFWHLRSEPFWTLVPRPGHLADVQRAGVTPSAARLLAWVQEARLHPQLCAAMATSEGRAAMRSVLVKRYFPERAASVAALRQFEATVYTYTKAIEQAAEPAPLYAAPAEPVRGTAFRRVVTQAYAFTCAVSRVRLTLPTGGQLVEAAHIHRWADSRDDRPQNGLALSPTYHWLFDQGLFTLDERRHVQVSPVARDCIGDVETLLTPYHGRPALLPANVEMHPGAEALAWHRANQFLRG